MNRVLFTVNRITLFIHSISLNKLIALSTDWHSFLPEETLIVPSRDLTFLLCCRYTLK